MATGERSRAFLHEHFLGFDIHRNEIHNVSIASTFTIVAGRFYRLWVDSVQDVYAFGPPPNEAVSNFTYHFAQVAFQFT